MDTKCLQQITLSKKPFHGYVVWSEQSKCIAGNLLHKKRKINS